MPNKKEDMGYKHGGVASDAKKNALRGLKSKMMSMGGNSLSDMMGSGDTVKASVTAKDTEGLKEGLEKASEMMEEVESTDREEYEDMSRAELLEFIKKNY